MFFGRVVEARIAADVKFSAMRSYIAASGVIVPGSALTNYDSEVDPGNVFSAGVFTAPIDGLYSLKFWCSLNTSLAAVPFGIYKNTSLRVSEYGSGGGGSATWYTAFCCAIVSMAPGDTASVIPWSGATPPNNHCRYQFTGHLL